MGMKSKAFETIVKALTEKIYRILPGLRRDAKGSKALFDPNHHRIENLSTQYAITHMAGDTKRNGFGGGDRGAESSEVLTHGAECA